MKKIPFWFFLLFVCIRLGAINSLPPTNFEIFMQLSLRYINFFEKEISTFQKDSIITFMVVNNTYASFFENLLISELSQKGWKFKHIDTNPSEQRSTEYIFSVFSFDIKYNNLSDENKLERNITINLRCIEKNQNSMIKPINKVFSYSDTISKEIIDYIEKDGFPFTSPKPKEEPSFFEKYFEPIAIIGASALIILLFFTIRSH